MTAVEVRKAIRGAHVVFVSVRVGGNPNGCQFRLIKISKREANEMLLGMAGGDPVLAVEQRTTKYHDGEYVPANRLVIGQREF